MILDDRERRYRDLNEWDAIDESDLLDRILAETPQGEDAPARPYRDLHEVDDPALGQPSLTQWQRDLDRPL